MSRTGAMTAQGGLTELVDLPGGRTLIGADDEYPEEAPSRDVSISPFRLEQHPVTVAQFAAFVAATGYRTMAERARPAAPTGRADDLLLRLPGSLVFVPTPAPLPPEVLRDDPEVWRLWWRFVPGASWHHPLGPLAGFDARARTPDHPVVHVCAADAEAYARWAGRRLPTADEFEHAARAGGTTRHAWGETAEPGRFELATTWQGTFPVADARFTDPADHRRHGWVGTSAVGATPPNPWGIQDLIGNVWEWTATSALHGPIPGAACCGARPLPDATARVVKGGSHLCAPEYCRRYRPAALQRLAVDAASTHLGFRCAI